MSHFFGFGDNSDYKLEVKQDSGGAWHWNIRDEKDVARALSALHGSPHGFTTHGSKPWRTPERSSMAWVRTSRTWT